MEQVTCWQARLAPGAARTAAAARQRPGAAAVSGIARYRQVVRTPAALAATVLGAVPLAFMPGIWPMATAITVAGLGISATLTSSYRIADLAVPAGQRTEAMSWLTTAAATGTALGAAVAGRLIDASGPTGGYLFACTAGLTALAVVIVRRHALNPTPAPGPGQHQPAAPGRGPSPGSQPPAPPRRQDRSPQATSRPSRPAQQVQGPQDRRSVR